MNNETTPKAAGSDFASEVIADFARAFMLMVGMGALHGEIAAVPHPGYWTAFLTIWGLQAVASVFKRRAE
jgi:hypothetical protein